MGIYNLGGGGGGGPAIPLGNFDGEFLTWNDDSSVWQTGPFQAQGVEVNGIAGDYTLDQSDQGKIVVLTDSTHRDVTVPPFGDNAYFQTGALIYLATSNTGHLNIVEGAGVTVHGGSSLNGAGKIATLINISHNEWLCHH